MNLAKQPMNTVLLITGDTDNNEANITDICRITETGMFKHIGKSVEDLKHILNEWYIKADGRY